MTFSSISPYPFLLFLGASILPVYYFSSGGVQPAHMVLALFSGLILLNKGIPLTSWFIAFFSIFMYSFLVEGFYALLHGSPKFLMSSVFFFYNCLLTSAVYSYVRDNGIAPLVLGIFVAAFLALFTILISGVDLREGGETGRATGTFNNPNQLGYFAVCLLSLAYLFYRHKSIGYWSAVGLFSISLFLAISSLSKAAMLASFFVIAFALMPVSSLNALFRWVIVVFLGGLALLYLYVNGAFDDFLFVQRLLAMMEEGDSSLEARGYFALLEGNFAQIAFGLGTQGVDFIVGHEVHSTLGSVVNNYGFIGLFIFIFLLCIWLYRLKCAYGFAGLICIAGPAMLYGITHNGTRFTIFWILYGASMAMAHHKLNSKNSFYSSKAICLSEAVSVQRN